MAELVDHALCWQCDTAATGAVGHLSFQCQVSLGNLGGGNLDISLQWILSEACYLVELRTHAQSGPFFVRNSNNKMGNCSESISKVISQFNPLLSIGLNNSSGADVSLSYG